MKGSPPHARGAVSPPTDTGAPEGITPACAGSSIPMIMSLRPTRDHPRMRGEQSSTPMLRFARMGSPPHARGAARKNKTKSSIPRITPACAGSSTDT